MLVGGVAGLVVAGVFGLLGCRRGLRVLLGIRGGRRLGLFMGEVLCVAGAGMDSPRADWASAVALALGVELGVFGAGADSLGRG